ncbi:MAG: PilZ domain-containing protein [Deltaproteobacteria bacterium]|nr:MAG: PilZ domain-containing protein [Deltaproteobacteria bacterium]
MPMPHADVFEGSIPDRRYDERIAVGVRAVLTYRDGNIIWTEADAGIADLSAGGMFVMCDRCPTHDQRVWLTFTSRRGVCRAIGRPVHFAGDARGGFGVQFDHVSDELRALLRDLRLLSPYGQAKEMAAIEDAQIEVR